MKRKYFYEMIFVFAVMTAVLISCKTEHNVAVETPEPIKIEARIDIYLHAESIEDMVSGKAPVPEAKESDKNRESLLKRIMITLEKEAFAHIITTDSMANTIEIYKRKQKLFEDTQSEMSKAICENVKINDFLKSDLYGEIEMKIPNFL